MDYTATVGGCLDIPAPALQHNHELHFRRNAQGPQGLPYDFTSAFERPVPLSVSQRPGQTLPEILQNLDTSVTVTIPASTLATSTVTTSISASIPALAACDPVASPPSSQSPIRSTVHVAATVAPSPMQPSPPQCTWQPPSLDEFLADVEDRRHQPILHTCSDLLTATAYLEETGQAEDPVELDDKEAFYKERFALVEALNPFFESSPDISRERPKRLAAEAAPKAWMGLEPRQRQRRQ